MKLDCSIGAESVVIGRCDGRGLVGSGLANTGRHHHAACKTELGGCRPRLYGIRVRAMHFVLYCTGRDMSCSLRFKHWLIYVSILYSPNFPI